MRQHPTPDPDPYKDEDLEELGAPVYEGGGLSVQALSAEELQRFLDARCWTASAARATRSSTTWPCRAPPPTSIT
jgi:hypothetical protein